MAASLQAALDDLHKHLRSRPWYLFSMPDPQRDSAILLYVNSRRADVNFLQNGWHGIPITVVRVPSRRSRR